MNQQGSPTRSGVFKVSVVDQVANLIREEVFQLPDGAFLGAEEDLVARYGVSRPTLREAARLIVQEQLLVARRGIGGGYFVRRPDAEIVTQIVALYLRAHKVELLDLTLAAPPIRREIVRLAAASRDDAARKEISDFLEEDNKLAGSVDFETFLQRERAFNHLLAKVSGSRILSLFFGILLDLGGTVQWKDSIFKGHPERFEAFRRNRRLLAMAILEGDEDLAMHTVGRPDLRSWLLEEKQDKDSPEN